MHAEGCVDAKITARQRCQEVASFGGEVQAGIRMIMLSIWQAW